MYACIHAPGAGALAQSFSPHIEMVDAQTAVFSITPRQVPGLQRISRAAVAETASSAIGAEPFVTMADRSETAPTPRTIIPF